MPIQHLLPKILHLPKSNLLIIIGLSLIIMSPFFMTPLSFSWTTAILAMVGVVILVTGYLIKIDIKMAPPAEKIHALLIATSIIILASAIVLYSFITVEWVPSQIIPPSHGSKPVEPIWVVTPKINHPYGGIAWYMTEIGVILLLAGLFIKIRTEFF